MLGKISAGTLLATSLAIALLGAPFALGGALAEDPPDVQLEAPAAWVGATATAGYTFSATACDEHGIDLLRAGIEDVRLAERSDAEECASVQPTAGIDRPGPYEVYAVADDHDFRQVEVRQTVVARLMPADLDRIEGYPPLDEVRTHDALRVTIDHILTKDGDVRGYEVFVDGETVASNMAEAVPHEGDRWVTVQLDPPTGWARIQLESQTLWSGYTVQTDDEWWRIRTVTGLAEEPTTLQPPTLG